MFQFLRFSSTSDLRFHWFLLDFCGAGFFCGFWKGHNDIRWHRWHVTPLFGFVCLSLVAQTIRLSYFSPLPRIALWFESSARKRRFVLPNDPNQIWMFVFSVDQNSALLVQQKVTLVRIESSVFSQCEEITGKVTIRCRFFPRVAQTQKKRTSTCARALLRTKCRVCAL